MRFFPHLEKRIFNTPLMIDPAKLQIIMAALAPRFGLDDAELDAALGGQGGPYAAGGVIDYARIRRTILPSGRHHFIGAPKLPDGKVEFELGDPWDAATAPSIDNPVAATVTVPVEASIHGEIPSATRFALTEAGIAIIDIHGTLVHTAASAAPPSLLRSYGSIEDDFRAALADPAVKGILLDIDSGGGEVSGAFDLADVIFNARGVKPIWAVADEVAFSAAYLLAASTDRVLVPRTGAVGAIGVLAMHLDRSERDKMEGTKFTTIFAGARKNDLNMHEPLSDDARDDIQASVDRTYDLFVDTVARSRPITAAQVRATEAALFDGLEGIAVDASLADEIMPFREALAALTERVDQATIFPQPILSGAASAASNPGTGKELRMNPDSPNGPETAATVAAETAASVPATPSGEVISIDEARAEGRAEANEIIQLCTLAGYPERAAKYVADGATAKKVRAELINKRAEEDDDETSGQHPGLPGAVATGGLKANMVKLLSQQGLTALEA